VFPQEKSLFKSSVLFWFEGVSVQAFEGKLGMPKAPVLMSVHFHSGGFVREQKRKGGVCIHSFTLFCSVCVQSCGSLPQSPRGSLQLPFKSAPLPPPPPPPPELVKACSLFAALLS